ncbi:type II toxin-antitoxin system RelE/ParE family toxin [Saccharicrinis sp. FJH2]|uniref:type II toxin-antitoxin system RelE/ParE family toxin n=1 Tax=Saccharicrinis sp. FJH65 TaxID=3344659 RepID=UPI0035F2DBC5
MNRSIKLSKLASLKLTKLLDYLEINWSDKVKNDFIKKLDKALDSINQHPDSFEKTKFVSGLHKCIVTKQTTIYYKYDDKYIYVVTLFDNRQNPDKLKKELK